MATEAFQRDDCRYSSFLMYNAVKSNCQQLQMDVDEAVVDQLLIPKEQMELREKVIYLKQEKNFVYEKLQNTAVTSSKLKEPEGFYSLEAKHFDRKENIFSSFPRTVVTSDSKRLSSTALYADNSMILDSVDSIELDDDDDDDDDVARSSPIFSSSVTAEEHLAKDMEQDYFTTVGAEAEQLEDEKTSNSSLTLAANRSLDMSRSLTDRCFEMAELAFSSNDLASEKLLHKRPRKSFSDDLQKGSRYDAVRITGKSLHSYSVSTLSPFIERKTLPQVCDSTEESPKSVQRRCIVQEIFETERKYCSCLSILLNHFADKLSQSGLLEEKDISVIFPPCLQRIYDYHSDFFEKLKRRLVDWTHFTMIADLFNQLVKSVDCDLLMQYQSYVALFPKAILHIKKLCRHNSEIEKFIKELERESCCEGLDIGAYLLTPIQRIPRYVLLLKQLMKCTKEISPDFGLLDSCLSKLGDFLNRLNASIETSIQLVSGERIRKRKKRFNFDTTSFRTNSSSDSNTSQTCNTRYQKKSSPLKGNRISLDLSFLGMLRQKKQPEVKDKLVRSELCLHKSAPVESCLPTDCLTKAVPVAPNSSSQQTCRSRKGALQFPFKLHKSKRKLEEPYTDCGEETSIPSKTKSKKARYTDTSKSLSLRLQAGGRALLHKLRRTGAQDISGFSNSFTELAVDSANSDNVQRLNEICDIRVESSRCENQPKQNLEEISCFQSEEITMTTDTTDFLGLSNSSMESSVLQFSAGELNAQLTVSSHFSEHSADTRSYSKSSDQSVNISSQNASSGSPCFFNGIFPPRRKSKLGKLSEESQVQLGKMEEKKQKMSVKDVLKSIFSRKDTVRNKGHPLSAKFNRRQL